MQVQKRPQTHKKHSKSNTTRNIMDIIRTLHNTWKISQSQKINVHEYFYLSRDPVKLLELCNMLDKSAIFCKLKDTPHSELLFRTELNQNTSNSGQIIFCHIIVSNNTLRPAKKFIRQKTKSRSQQQFQLISTLEINCLLTMQCKLTYGQEGSDYATFYCLPQRN